MKFRDYIREFKEALLKVGKDTKASERMFSKMHHGEVIIFYYTRETGLVWVDFNGDVYRNGKVVKRDTPVTGHAQLAIYAGDGAMNWFEYDNLICGRITRDETVAFWGHGGIESKTRKYLKNKVWDAIYKYIKF